MYKSLLEEVGSRSALTGILSYFADIELFGGHPILSPYWDTELFEQKPGIAYWDTEILGY